MDIYGRIAPHYDLLFPVSETQAAFLRRALEEADARRVLDAGCGVGRHLELLREWNFEIAGLEPDPEMAELARERLGGEVDVAVATLETAAEALSGPFDAALCLGNTLAHLVEPGALAAGLKALACLLAPGGMLITQTVNFDRVLAEGRAPFAPKHVPDGAGGSLRFDRDYDFTEAPIRLGFKLSLSGPDIDLEDTIPLRPLTREEQEQALAEAGFESIKAWGDWDAREWTPEAPATLLSCVRTRQRR